VEERQQSDVEYKGLGVQRETGKEASGPIYQSIDIYQCSQTMTA